MSSWGARQVGKTTLVDALAVEFKQYLYLNLELPEDWKPFQNFTKIDDLVQVLFLAKNTRYIAGVSTLIFIDEIQEVPAALNIFRYFYEQLPAIHVLAATIS